jgi:hypothetical protein
MSPVASRVPGDARRVEAPPVPGGFRTRARVVARFSFRVR